MSKTQQNWIAVAAVIFTFVVSGASIVFGYGVLNERVATMDDKVKSAEECCGTKADHDAVSHAFDKVDNALIEIRRDQKTIMLMLPALRSPTHRRRK